MKKNCNRLLALLLSLSMVLSLNTGAVLAAQSTQEPDSSVSAAAQEGEESSRTEGEESTGSAQTEEPEGSQSAQTEEQSVQQSAESSQTEAEQSAQPAQTEEQSSPETQSGEAEADDTLPEQEETAQEEAVQEELSAQEEQPQGTLNITQTQALTLEYDDRFSFSSVGSGYVVAQITEQHPTSYVVSEGRKTGTLDEAVVTMSSGSDTDAVATGTGTATVVMVRQGDLAAAKALLTDPANATQSVDAIQVNVEVRSAPLTIMFLAGQSNMEGWGAYPGYGSKSQSAYQFPEQSVVCPEGEVYTTYAPGDSAVSRGRANSIGGHVNFSSYNNGNNARKFVAESLTSIYPIDHSDGLSLVYRLNQFTEKGTGKTGPDSGMAYEWNRLTGDKVWTVNAAVGSSSISLWTPGKKCYERAKAVFTNALNVYNAEISAGHYTQSHKLFFWLQGEADKNYTASAYLNSFKTMHKYMKQTLDFEQMGLIAVRASTSSKHYRDSLDLTMTGPRLVQSFLANTNHLGDVHMVSNANENWVYDGGVKSYFQSVYGGALNYKTHGSTPDLPTTVTQAHNDIHYSQVAHNENGITAARGMYNVISGGAQPTSVKWRNAQGKAVSAANLSKGGSMVLSPVVSDVAASKKVNWVFSSGLQYSASSGVLKVTGTGKQQIQAVAPDGRVLSTLVVSKGSSVGTPAVKSIKNVKGKKLKVAIKGVKGASGYQIQCSASEDFSSGAKTASGKKKSVIVKGLTAGKTYYVRVRAWKKSGGKVFSAWSAVKSAKVVK